MEIPPFGTSPVMAAAVRRLGALPGIQAELIKQISQTQEQIAEMLYAQGVGRNVDIEA